VPFVRWYEWGGKTISETVTHPGKCGADQSPLVAVLNDDNHRDYLKLPDRDLRRIFLWLDANAPFYGVYRDAALARQLAGEAVAPPELQ